MHNSQGKLYFGERKYYYNPKQQKIKEGGTSYILYIYTLKKLSYTLLKFDTFYKTLLALG